MPLVTQNFNPLHLKDSRPWISAGIADKSLTLLSRDRTRRTDEKCSPWVFFVHLQNHSGGVQSSITPRLAQGSSTCASTYRSTDVIEECLTDRMSSLTSKSAANSQHKRDALLGERAVDVVSLFASASRWVIARNITVQAVNCRCLRRY